MRQVAYAAEHPVLPCLHVDDIRQEKRGRKRIIDTADCAVGIGMHTDDGNPVADSQTKHTAGGVVCCYATDRCKNRRMMRNNQLSAALDCFLDYILGRVQCAEHACNLCRAVTAQQADVIPAFRELRRGESLQKIEYIRYSCHSSPSSAVVNRCTSIR